MIDIVEELRKGCDCSTKVCVMDSVSEDAADEIERLRAALEALLERYTGLVNSGDCGNWDCEQENEVIAAREALKQSEKE